MPDNVPRCKECGLTREEHDNPEEFIPRTAPTPPSVPTRGYEDDYVAWLRASGKGLVVCDSTSPGAFKVWRHIEPIWQAAHKAGRLEGFTAGWWAAMEKAVFIIENFGRNKPNLLFSTRTDLVAALREAATPAAPEKTR